MKIANSTENLNSMRELVSDSLRLSDLNNPSKNNASYSNQNPISKIEDVATLAHQVLGQKMTQVNTVA